MGVPPYDHCKGKFVPPPSTAEQVKPDKKRPPWRPERISPADVVTLRDQFAIEAMKAFVPMGWDDPNEMAKESYAAADAMMKARSL